MRYALFFARYGYAIRHYGATRYASTLRICHTYASERHIAEHYYALHTYTHDILHTYIQTYKADMLLQD